MYTVTVVEQGIPVTHEFSDRSQAALFILRVGTDNVLAHNVPDLNVG